VDDLRPHELLEEAARAAWRLRLALAWSDGLTGEKAKACTRSGRAAWKHAEPLNVNEGAAVGYFITAARKRNPAVVASRSGLLLVEADLDVDDSAYPSLDEVKAGVGALMRRLKLRFPSTVIVRSRRGLHFYLKPPAGAAAAKVQLAEDGDSVTWVTDGYVIGVPGLYGLAGVTYEYVRGGEIATLPAEIYERLVELGGESRAESRRAFKAGEPIPTGERRETVFGLALERARDDVPRGLIVEELLEMNAHQCRPPLSARQVEQQIDGAITWARRHPTEAERTRAEARRILNGRHDYPSPKTAPVAGTAASWEAPVPFAARGEMPTFPLETLRGWAAAWATAIADEKGAALDLSGNLVLDVIAGAIARHVQVSPRPGWWEPTNLYTIVALAPGQRKSPVFKAALRPVRTLERQLIRAWEEQMALTKISEQILDKRRKHLIDEAASDDELDPEQLHARMDDLLAGLGPTKPVPRPRLLTEDATPEALAGLLADHGRIIAASDEGGSLVENMAGRYARGSTSWDTLNKAHSSVDLVVDRKSSGPVIVFDPTVTLAITTQPELLRTLAGKPGVEGRGVLARPLYVLPAAVYVGGVTAPADPATLDEYTRRVLNIYVDTPQLETDEDEHPRPTLLTFTNDARCTFERFEAELNRERRELGGDDVDGDSVYLGWLSKLAGQTARLVAILHVADHWTDGTGAALLVVDEPTVARAVKLGRYYRVHALAVFGLMGELPEQRRAVAILRWLRSRSAGEFATLTVRVVHRSRGTGTTGAQVQMALRLLEAHGYVRIEKLQRVGRGGRAAERVHVHPELKNTTNRTDKSDVGTLAGSSVAFVGPKADVSFCTEHPDTAAWQARDGAWRCRVCDPPVSAGEVVEEREA
jgi:hypothetical protein